MKTKALLLSLLLTMAMAAEGKQKVDDIFKPYVSTDLRMPSVPVVVNDPYFSIWSPYDRLTDGTTSHWTGREKPLLGLLRVDGKVFRFLGKQQEYLLASIAPMANETRWQGMATYSEPDAGWQAEDFDDTSWKKERAAWGDSNQRYVGTNWTGTPADVYVRREVNLTKEQLQEDLFLKYSHDDVFELYVNGTEVVSTGYTWKNNVTKRLSASEKNLFHEGKNIIAMHCHNTLGSQYADFGLYYNVRPDVPEAEAAVQKSLDVLATSTYSTFLCGPVELDVVFTAPMLIDDYDLLSVPVNYISYQVRSIDGKKHDVQFYLGTSPLHGVNHESQPTISTIGSQDGVRYVRTGTIEQPVLAKSDDDICIDWGYFYLPAINGEVALTRCGEAEKIFTKTGKLAQTATAIRAYKPGEMPDLAFVNDLGRVASYSNFALVGYDEVWDIEYMYKHYKAYWAHEGQTNIFQAFRNLEKNYASVMARCRSLDKTIYDDGMAAGGKEYAELLSGSYRHVMAGHKLFRDDEGHLLWFSKENDSNGCVNTVDVTYPSVPLFLLYNPELVKAMLTSIFEYSQRGCWTRPYPSHDLGTYPLANGRFMGDHGMPVEEAGNMLILSAMLCQIDGNTKYVEPYWELLTTWADYLKKYGVDPGYQLCTDDFTGQLAHNCNLSVKSTLGIMAYSKLLALHGEKDKAVENESLARQMAKEWETNARDGDHYRLAFDREDTWSQKYNMVWDDLWGTGLFPAEVKQRELNYYLTLQNQYGLPLDCRADFTKSDWIMWTAAMAADKTTFRRFMLPVYKYVDETESRVPVSDWHDTKTGRHVRFKARTVVGGYWMRVFMERVKNKIY
ncbi:MAG: DUF4965 domain-containing protein [Prevotella sp.]|nr:DUF4965 domain-containing protein [Prevotella sp.]